jgi:hypothetical protein
MGYSNSEEKKMSILDRLKEVLGQRPEPEVDPSPEMAGPFTELGSTGLRQVGGVVTEEWQPRLQGEQGVRTYREMSEGDPTVGAVLFAIEMLVRQVHWGVEPAGTEERDIENAAFLESCMNDLDRPWTSLISEVLTMLTYGWSVHEIVYKVRRGTNANPPSAVRDGRIGWRGLPIRGQSTLLRWELGQHEQVDGFTQIHPTTYKQITIPSEKMIHFRTKDRRGPEGLSVLRNAYRPWLYKKRLEEIEAIGIERDMAGLPVAHVPSELLDANASGGQKALLGEIKKLVRGIKINEQMGVVFPHELDVNGQPRYKLELLSSTGSKAKSPGPSIERYKTDIAMSVLADFIFLGHAKSGSYALSSSKTELFAAAIGSWLDTIADTISMQAVPRLFRMNGIPGPYPKIAHGDIETPDLGELGSFILNLSNAGALTLPDDRLERHLRRVASLPEPDDDTEI